ncbi:ECF RNA polymerase sigma factor SigK [Lacisediminihabitans sp. H27-G8]|uniref:ECF RNA polymerase sigma factor SigK n=1 Tax=Lacisediminihabitans sp. H27-G8 TaxID=3111909 RepID=UPI0038FD078C
MRARLPAHPETETPLPTADQEQPLARPDSAAAEGLLQRIAAGDQAAFAELFDEFAPRVYRHIRAVLRDQSQSEEVMQEVFLEVWQQAARFDPGRGTAVGWILTRAHARAVDRVRSAEADRARDTKFGLRDFEPGYDSVAEAVELRLDSERVIRALGQLSELQREALVLAFVGNLTHVEVAERLRLPLGTVKSRIHDGLRQMRRMLEDSP